MTSEYFIIVSLKGNSKHFVLKLFENEIKLQSDGSPQRDFIHRDNVAGAIDVLIKNENSKLNNIFHIASSQTMTIMELAHSIKAVYQARYNKDIQVILPNKTVSDNPDALSKSERYVINNSRLKALGLKTQMGLKDGIHEIFDYLENSYE